MEKGGANYIISNHSNTTLYVGVTSDIISRIIEHKTNKHHRSFTARYKLHKLVYYEQFHDIEEAIHREKQLKSGSRKKKLELIDHQNPERKDLWEEISQW